MSDIEKKEIDQAAKDYKETQENYKYIAFISYRHLEPDATIAKKIHTMIETFKLPKEFYIDGKKPNFRVFRDREELTTASLSASIDDALRNSKYLIIICSKRLPLSEWCNIEAETFIRLHGVDRVIPVLVEGEPEESFPKALLNPNEELTIEDGAVEVHNTDILAAEFRTEQVKSKDFEGYEYLEKNNPSKLKQVRDEALKQLKDEKYRIMAAILGVAYGDLRQRDRVRRQRRLLALSGIIGAALLFFGIFMFNAYRNENIAKRQTIQDKAAFMLDKSEELLNKGDRFKAMLLSNNAISQIDEKMKDYINLTNRHRQLLNNSVNLINPVFDKTIVTNNEFTFLSYSEDGKKLVAGLDNDSIGQWDVKTGNLLRKATGHKQQVKLVVHSIDDSLLASGGFDGIINIWRSDDLEKLQTRQLDGNVMLMQFTSDNKYLDVIIDSLGKYIYQRFEIDGLKEVGNQMLLDNGIKRIVFDAESKYMWVLYTTRLGVDIDKSLIKYDLEKHRSVKSYKEHTAMIEDFLAEKDKNGNRPMKESSFPYLDLRSSNDNKYLYLINDKQLIKLDLENDKIVFESEEFSNSASKDINLVETKDGKYFYFNDGYRIVKCDSNTGKKILEINHGEGGLKWITMSKKTDKLAALTKNQSIFIVEKDQVTKQISPLDSGASDYIYLSPDGDNLISLSLTETKIKIADLSSADDVVDIEGQIVAVSDNQNFALVNNDAKYEVWDTRAKKKLRTIKSERLIDRGTVSDDSKYIISNDGNYVAGIESYILVELKKEDSRIFVIDTRDSKEVYTNPEARYKAKIGFSPDSKLVYFTVGTNDIVICSIEEKKVLQTVHTLSNYLSDVKLYNQNFLFANFVEGVGEVYNIKEDKRLGTVVGHILNMEEDKDGKIKLDVIYGNVASTYLDFEKSSEVKLTPKRSEHGVSLKESLAYNPKEDLLLSVKSLGDKHYFYLIDFKTGELIKSFETELPSYRPMVFITEDGKNIGYDRSFTITSGLTIADLKNYSKAVISPILSYEELKDKAIKELEGVKLTKSESEELKID